MSNFDDIFDSAPSPAASFDKDAWVEQKQAQRQAVYELADKTALSVAGNGKQFQDYLDVQARFDRYSATNALLILAQMPQATQLKDFDDWKDMGVSIKKHQKGFSILEPGKEYDREDGSKGVNYNVKKVFDISQTTAKAPPKPTVNMDDRLLLKALISNPPVPIQTVDTLPQNAGAYYDQDQQVIFVRRGMEPYDIFRSMSKELAHAELAQQNPNSSRSQNSFAAYCASYLLCKKYGVDVGGYNFSRLPEEFSQGDAQSIRNTLTQVRDAASDISARMARSMEQSRSAKPKSKER